MNEQAERLLARVQGLIDTHKGFQRFIDQSKSLSHEIRYIYMVDVDITYWNAQVDTWDVLTEDEKITWDALVTLEQL